MTQNQLIKTPLQKALFANNLKKFNKPLKNKLNFSELRNIKNVDEVTERYIAW